jgi:regulator of protease activity HflC (stomatin/prohibitin superfamily)
MKTQEHVVEALNGWTVLTGVILYAILAVPLFWISLSAVPLLIAWSLAIAVWAFVLGGFYTLQPNQAKALVLFGRYVGTDKTSGFRWANPLYSRLKSKVSLRAHNLNMKPIKVNDLRGNPIEIAAVVVWKVGNTAEALFDVEGFEHYVEVQSESALRHLAMAYPYDEYGAEPLSLRGSTDEISHALQAQIQERVAQAGVAVLEAKLSHLAYAQEIAGAMLRRQQAEAVVAARTRIVEGAIGMVEHALKALEAGGTVKLDEERKAAMVSNLLVVLCGQNDAQPVINTGTLYT